MIEVGTISLPTYLTVQIQEILSYGTDHFLTWAPTEEWRLWFQLSISCSNQYRFCVQFPLPPLVSPRQLDRVFGQAGWEQAGISQSLVYYLAGSNTLKELELHVERVALQCALAMRLLWNVTTMEEILLLGARGHRIPLAQCPKETVPLRRIA